MGNEYEILSHLEKNQETSQRQIAQRTGLSLGTVNLLLKKMVRKGLVKIEKLNAKTLRYIITPHGMAEKTRLAYQYMKISYQQILKISRALEQVVADHEARYGQAKEVIFYGPRDEVLEILKMAAGNLGLKYSALSSTDELNHYLISQSNSPDNKLENLDRLRSLIIIWETETENDLPEGIQKVNILSKM